MVASMSYVQPASHHSFFFSMTFCTMDFTKKKGLLIVYIITNTTIIIIIMVIIIIIVIISHPCCPT